MGKLLFFPLSQLIMWEFEDSGTNSSIYLESAINSVHCKPIPSKGWDYMFDSIESTHLHTVHTLEVEYTK